MEALKGLKGFKILEQKMNHGFIELLVDKNEVFKTLETLKKTQSLRCNNLHCISGVDYVDYMEVVYHLYSYKLGHKIALKVRVTKEDNELDSAYPLWKTADWQEREIFEMYGIKFNGHPNLTNLLLTDDFPGYPLRKDFPLTNNEEWLLQDNQTAKDYGLPDDLSLLLKKNVKNNGEKK